MLGYNNATMAGPEGTPIPAEAIGVSSRVTKTFDVQDHGAVDVSAQIIAKKPIIADGVLVDLAEEGVKGDEVTVFQLPEGIGYQHEPGETYARVNSKLGRDIQLLVPPQGPFPDIPRDEQRIGHQAVRDRILVQGDVKTVLKPSEKTLREMPRKHKGFRGYFSPRENYAQPVNEKAVETVYDEALMRESLGLALSERYIHEDFDARAEMPVADMGKAIELARIMREAVVTSGLMTQEEADKLITASRVLRYDDEEIMQEVEAGNVELLDGARTQEVDFVMGALRILDQTRPVQPIPRRRGVKIRNR